MRYWYDTEFLEDGERIWPISIGIVAEDDREYYAVNAAIASGAATCDRSAGPDLHYRITHHRWLMDNVVPYLPLTEPPARPLRDFHLDMSSTVVKPWWVVRNEIRSFILSPPVDPSDETEVELWAWYGAYDHVVLAQTFGQMINLPTGMPMFTKDLRQKIDDLGMPEEVLLAVPGPGNEHHALNDALALRRRWYWALEHAEGRW